MIISEIFILSSLLSFIILFIYLIFNSIYIRNKFNFYLQKTIQMDKIKKEEFNDFFLDKNRYIKGNKLWFLYLFLEIKGDNSFIKKASQDLKINLNFLQSACILYLSKFKAIEYIDLIYPFLKNENILLRYHSILSMSELFKDNFELFKERFDEKPSSLIDVGINLFEKIKKEEKKELFKMIRKHFSKNENVILKTVDYIEDFFEEIDYEDLLYQLDVFPLSFQEKFLKIFSKKMEVKNYIKYFNFKYDSLPKELRYVYVYPFANYYSDLDFNRSLEFINKLNDKEIEIFFKEYFPSPENYISLLKTLKKEFTLETYEIILEKISLLRYENAIDLLESIIEKTKQKDRILFKFSNLILDWKKDDIKKILFWILTKTENPAYRDKISNLIREMKFDI